MSELWKKTNRGPFLLNTMYRNLMVPESTFATDCMGLYPSRSLRFCKGIFSYFKNTCLIPYKHKLPNLQACKYLTGTVIITDICWSVLTLCSELDKTVNFLRTQETKFKVQLVFPSLVMQNKLEKIMVTWHLTLNFSSGEYCLLNYNI